MITKDSLSIADLHLDERNPRFNPANGQKEAIELMFKEQESKLYELALDIVKHGLDPSKTFIVFQENNKYVVGDGNRRLTVLKALETPDLIEIENKKILSQFKELSKQFKLNNLTKIDCVIYDKREDARH